MGGKASSVVQLPWCQFAPQLDSLEVRGFDNLKRAFCTEQHFLLFTSIMNLEGTGIVCSAVNDVSSAVSAKTRQMRALGCPWPGRQHWGGGRGLTLRQPPLGAGPARGAAGTYLGAQGRAPSHRRSHWARTERSPGSVTDAVPGGLTRFRGR